MLRDNAEDSPPMPVELPSGADAAQVQVGGRRRCSQVIGSSMPPLLFANILESLEQLMTPGRHHGPSLRRSLASRPPAGASHRSME